MCGKPFVALDTEGTKGTKATKDANITENICGKPFVAFVPSVPSVSNAQFSLLISMATPMVNSMKPRNPQRARSKSAAPLLPPNIASRRPSFR
jgi:hypothetical protein